MSNINTNGIDVNYPVPGVNNNSQGFRDNFASIKTNLNTASNEITDLQNKVVVKQALANSSISNDMANTLISNALTRSFRATTYNLGGALSGIVPVNVSLGDVQYGTLSANSNITLQFTNWSPNLTQSNVQLLLSVVDNNSYIRFGGTNIDDSITTLENYQYDGGNLAVSAPSGVTELYYRLSTTTCGDTITIEPYDRPRQSTEIQTRTISPVGFPGDVSGTVSVSTSYNQLNITSTSASDYFTTSGNTTQLFTDMPIVFTGVSMESNITVGTTYYVRNVVSSTTFTVSTSLGGSNVNLAGNGSPTSQMNGNPVSSLYICTDSYDATTYEKSVIGTNSSGNITLNNTTSLSNNSPILFAGDVVGGLIDGAVYYIKTIDSGNSNITVSQTRTNGVAGTAYNLTTATPSNALTATCYVGSDIWKKINLTSW